MIAPLTILLSSVALTFASPLLEVRTVAALNQGAFEEAQQKDNTATKAFSGTQIKVCFSLAMGGITLTIDRPQLAIVCSSMNCPETSVQI